MQALTTTTRALAIAACVSCGHKTSQSADATPAPIPTQDWSDTEDRLISMLDQGFVVSRDAGNAAKNQGDGAIWTGVAMASMSCAKGAPLADAIEAMMGVNLGGIYRHPSLPNETSLDQALGVYRGITHRIMKCGESARWQPLLQKHHDLGKINPNSDVTVPAEFTYVRDLLFAKVNVGNTPAAARQAVLETEIAGWIDADKKAKSGCYRAHLGLLALQTIEALGGRISGLGKKLVCDAEAGMSLPTFDQWCGNDALPAYLGSFQYDQWQYRHQRCPGWEQPDGQGLKQPAVDRLRAMADLYPFTY